ncbi:hypothetical protein [Gimesia sp.]|uniref:hypothetical protein n=1 Tax=Gimesia sp. TaxID=2024833 RepID=UPI003A8FCF71
MESSHTSNAFLTFVARCDLSRFVERTAFRAEIKKQAQSRWLCLNAALKRETGDEDPE